MGDPRKLKRKYASPSHPWQKERIEEEKIIMQSYGLKNKKDVWRMYSKLRSFYGEAKRLVAAKTKQHQAEASQLVKKLQNFGLLKPDAEIHNVLSITIKDLMDIRLQSILVRQGIARTMTQSRQFITHGHVNINGKRINQPSYLVTVNEHNLIQFNPNSSFADDGHPERAVVEKPKNGRTKG